MFPDINGDTAGSFRGADGYTMIQSAVMTRNFDLARLFLKAGVNINAVDPHNRTIAMLVMILVKDYADERGRCPWDVGTFLRDLLKYGPDLNIRDSTLTSPLHVAIVYSVHQVVRMLINSGADANFG